MQHRFLIITIILCSLISWVIGSVIFLSFFQINTSMNDQEKTATPVVIEKEKTYELKTLQENITSIAQDIAPSVVSIIIRKDLVIYRSDPWGFFQQPTGAISRQVWGGSGFFINKNGTILTNKHVVLDKNADYTVILNDGTEYDGKVLALDPINDLAVIKIMGNNDFIPLSLIQDENQVKIWSFSIAIWNALAEFQNSVSLGIISGKDRTIQAGGESLSGLLQTDAAINPGNSWWPLINLDGKAIWINTAIVSGSNGIGFSIALTQDKVDYMLDSIEKDGKIKRPFIGINYIQNSPGVARELWLSVNYGAYIINEAGSIIEWTSAAEAWLEPGDIILEVNKIVLNKKDSLGSIIRNSIPGDMLSLKVLKTSGEQKNLELELWAY